MMSGVDLISNRSLYASDGIGLPNIVLKRDIVLFRQDYGVDK
jgi:hypothetical protein